VFFEGSTEGLAYSEGNIGNSAMKNADAELAKWVSEAREGKDRLWGKER
jgi:hypothetical protein